MRTGRTWAVLPQAHIRVKGFWEKFYFRPESGLPGLPDGCRQDRRLYLLRPALPGRRLALGLNGAEIVFIPSAHLARPVQYLWRIEQPSAHPGRQRLLHRHHQPGRHRAGPRRRRLLRAELLRGPAWPVRRRSGAAYEEELVIRDLDLDKIMEVRNTWQFYRDRRPDAYADLTRL